MTLNIDWSEYHGRIVTESFHELMKKHNCSEHAVKTAFIKHGIKKTDNRMNKPEIIDYGLQRGCRGGKSNERL